MKQHKINFYRDGHEKVEFCKLCGKEGFELLVSECSGEFEEKKVDKNEEPD